MITEATRVLIVDDAAQNRASLQRLLAQASFTIAGEAALGPEAVAEVKEAKPDVVLVAVEDPATRALRTIETLTMAVPGTPVVAVSSLSEREYMRRAMLAGARDYLVKPISAEDLETSLLALVELEQKRSSLAEDAVDTGRTGEIVTVLGAKGGIGRTTIAANLAVALAIEGKHKVALVDLDTQLGDVALLLDIVPEKSLGDVVSLIDRLDPELMRGFLSVHSSGLKVLPAPLRLEDGERITSAHVRRVLQVLSRTYDFVVVDTPRAFHDNTVTALDVSSLVIVVTTLDVACLKSTKVCLSILRSWRYPTEKVKLLINHVNNVNGIGNAEVESAVDYPIFWRIPNDTTTMTNCSRAGKPFVQTQPAAAISRNMISLSYSVAGDPPPTKGIMSRLRGK
ncbi:MAG: response regulator [Chloroflexota bacterium]|nr:MAG: response regulator [Chloroflexota bacterium]